MTRIRRFALAALAAVASLAALALPAAASGHPAAHGALPAQAAQATSVIHDASGAHVVYHPQTAAQVRADIAAQLNFTNSVCTYYHNGSGNFLCLAASSITDGTAVTANVSSNVRTIDAIYKFTCCGNSGVYRLEFDASTSHAVGFSGSGKGEVRGNSGDTNNTNWLAQAGGPYNSVYWQNHTYGCTSQYGALASTGTGGDQTFCFRGSGFELWNPAP